MATKVVQGEDEMNTEDAEGEPNSEPGVSSHGESGEGLEKMEVEDESVLVKSIETQTVPKPFSPEKVISSPSASRSDDLTDDMIESEDEEYSELAYEDGGEEEVGGSPRKRYQSESGNHSPNTKQKDHSESQCSKKQTSGNQIYDRPEMFNGPNWGIFFDAEKTDGKTAPAPSNEEENGSDDKAQATDFSPPSEWPMLKRLPVTIKHTTLPKHVYLTVVSATTGQELVICHAKKHSNSTAFRIFRYTHTSAHSSFFVTIYCKGEHILCSSKCPSDIRIVATLEYGSSENLTMESNVIRISARRGERPGRRRYSLRDNQGPGEARPPSPIPIRPKTEHNTNRGKPTYSHSNNHKFGHVKHFLVSADPHGGIHGDVYTPAIPSFTSFHPNRSPGDLHPLRQGTLFETERSILSSSGVVTNLPVLSASYGGGDPSPGAPNAHGSPPLGHHPSGVLAGHGHVPPHMGMTRHVAHAALLSHAMGEHTHHPGYPPRTTNPPRMNPRVVPAPTKIEPQTHLNDHVVPPTDSSNPFYISFCPAIPIASFQTKTSGGSITFPLQKLTSEDRGDFDPSQASIIIKCHPLSSSAPNAIQHRWPPGCILKLNNFMFMTQKGAIPGEESDSNEPTEMIGNVTVACRLGLNTLTVYFMERDDTSYYFVIQVMKKQSVQKVMSLLPPIQTSGSHLLSKTQGEAQVKSYFKEQNIEFYKFSLLDPSSHQRIKLPARGVGCRHLACFDLETWVTNTSRTFNFSCPNCLCPLPFDQLRVDNFFLGILEKIPSTLNSINIYPDGNWGLAAEAIVEESGSNEPRDDEPALNFLFDAAAKERKQLEKPSSSQSSSSQKQPQSAGRSSSSKRRREISPKPDGERTPKPKKPKSKKTQPERGPHQYNTRTKTQKPDSSPS